MYDEYSFVLDIDGTICPIKKPEELYENVVPYENVVKRIRFYHDNGAKIVLFTSRNMKTYKKNTGRILLDWLDKWDIPYDELIFGKPWPGFKGFYVDDRTVRPDEFLTKSPDELLEICS